MTLCIKTKENGLKKAQKIAQQQIEIEEQKAKIAQQQIEIEQLKKKYYNILFKIVETMSRYK